MKRRINTKKEVRDIAREVLKFLERERINHFYHLENKAGKKSSVRNKRGHLIAIKKNHHYGEDSPTSTVSYSVHRGASILEARLNAQRDYTCVVVRGAFELSGYTNLTRDEEGNVTQMRSVEGCSIEELRRNLELLAYNREQPHHKL